MKFTIAEAQRSHICKKSINTQEYHRSGAKMQYYQVARATDPLPPGQLWDPPLDTKNPLKTHLDKGFLFGDPVGDSGDQKKV